MSEGIWPEVLIGDCRVLLDQMAPESVHSVITSPPYYSLRDYGTGTWEGGDPGCDHRAEVNGTRNKGRDRAVSGGTFHDSPHINTDLGIPFRDVCGKCGARRVDQQIGLEPTFAEHLEVMVGVCQQIRRVLRRDGIMWLNLGDAMVCKQNGRSAADTKAAGKDNRTFRDKPFSTGRNGSLKEKDMMGMPWRLAFALQADEWYLRSAITWVKPGPMPESVVDRPTQATEMVFMFTKEPRYFYDQEAVRPLAKTLNLGRSGNLLNWWMISAQPLGESHYAAFPEALVEPLVLCSTSERGCCPACGAGWRRVTDKSLEATKGKSHADSKRDGGALVNSSAGHSGGVYGRYNVLTTGWAPACQCGREGTVPAVILDPFCGSGTTLRVATKLGRKSIGIELSESYIEISNKRNAQGGLGL